MNTPYRHPAWRKLRPYILARDQHHCTLNLPGCKQRATEVDHIVDWQDGGAPLDPANLRSACKSCNVAQRNTRVAQRARAHRQPNSRAW